MNWNYRVAKKQFDGEDCYGIIEVYYEEGEVMGWTDFVDLLGWDNPEDLKGTLELMLKAFDKPIFEGEVE